MDVLSLIQNVLVVPGSIHDDYPGITIVSSAGNSGPGYGTIGLPNASPFGISVWVQQQTMYFRWIWTIQGRTAIWKFY